MGETEGPSVDEARCSLGSVLVGEVDGSSANLHKHLWAGGALSSSSSREPRFSEKENRGSSSPNRGSPGEEVHRESTSVLGFIANRL